MKTKSIFLFIIPALIWGSTWYIIKFQLGTTDPLISVSLRFAIAGLLLLAYCLLLKKNLSYSLRQHLFMLLQGLCLFGFNYYFVYLSEESLTSGLVAASFSMIIFLNVFFGALFLKIRIEPKVVLGAIIGIAGIVLVFNDEISAFTLSDKNFLGVIYCLIGIVFASMGNITSAYNQRIKLPVIQSNTFGMLYGAAALFLVSVITGSSFEIDTRWEYWSSLLYLSIFGSVIAFGSYLQLIGKTGPDKAAFVLMVVPLIALMISSFLEDFEWTVFTISGA